MRATLLSISSIFLLHFSIAASAFAAPVLPVNPAELLPLLPAAPVDWKLTGSRAYNEVSGQPGLISLAIRDYLQVPPPSPDTPTPAAPVIPATVNVTLIDGAGNPDPARLSAMIRKADSSRPSEKHYAIDGVAVMEESAPQQQTFTFDLNSRLILVLTLRNADEKLTKAWLERLNLPALLTAAKKAGKERVPVDVLNIAYVDEFNPKSNRVTQMHLPED